VRGWRRLTRAEIGALGAVLLCGCASITDRVAEVEAKLVGVKARELSRCVGAPFSVDEDGETEYLTYRWFDEEESDPLAQSSYPRAPDPDRFPGDSRPRAPGPPADRMGDDDPDDDTPPRGVAYCELVFEVRGGVVRSVEVEGRRASGLNDNVNCILKAERCIAP